MNSEIEELLALVDEWKFRLYEKLKDLTPEQEAEFWKKAQERGLRFLGPQRKKSKPRRTARLMK